VKDPTWRWLIPFEPISGPCGRCMEPLLKHRDGLVSYRQDSYHLHCLIDKLTEEAPPPTPLSWNGI
jgi:hypothetical protein